MNVLKVYEDTIHLPDYSYDQKDWVVEEEGQYYYISYVSQIPSKMGPETVVWACDEDGQIDDLSNYLYVNDLHTEQLGYEDAARWIALQSKFQK